MGWSWGEAVLGKMKENRTGNGWALGQRQFLSQPNWGTSRCILEHRSWPAPNKLLAGNCWIFHNHECMDAQEGRIQYHLRDSHMSAVPIILAWTQACRHILRGVQGASLFTAACRQAVLLLCGNLSFPFPTVSWVSTCKLLSDSWLCIKVYL